MPTNQQPENKENPKRPEHSSISYMRYANMGFQMAAIMGLGVWGGYKLDQVTQLKFPVFTIVLSLLAVVVAIYFVIKDLLKK